MWYIFKTSKMKFLWILIFYLFYQVLAKQWIDPHDMNTNSKSTLKKSSSTGHLTEYHNKHDHGEMNIDNNSFIYLKRFVNLLLNTASIDKSDPVKYNGQLQFSIDNEKFKFLKDFSNNEHADLDQLRKLDLILSDMFHKNYFDHISDMLVSSQEKIFRILLSKHSWPFWGLIMVVYVSYNLFKSNFSLQYILRYLILLVMLVDFAQRYQELYEKAEEHNMHVKYSSKCDTLKMNWSEYFRFMTGSQDCESKTVSLLDVGLLQIKSVIIVPLSAVGTGMGQFASELWKNLPFPWNILIFPAMLFFCIILAAIIITISSDTPFKINLMHLFHFEFGKKPGITGSTMEKILINLTHRPMFEEINGTKNEKSSPKKKFGPKSNQMRKKEVKDDKNSSDNFETVKNKTYEKESKESNIPEKESNDVEQK